MARVLLIQSPWPARALLKAELEERGFDVLAADSVPLALDLSMARGFSPDALVIDAADLALDTAEVERLLFLRGNSPLLLIRSALYRSPEVATLLPTRQMVRPVTVGEVADAVDELTLHR